MTLEMIWRKSEAQREKRTFLIFNYFNMITVNLPLWSPYFLEGEAP